MGEKKQSHQSGLQPGINVGLVGHVDHGKTTLTEKLTGKWTDTHSEEIKRGITIRLGYANVTIRKCETCPEPDCYTTHEECPHCKRKTKEVRKISFVDAPGHESLMATMLSGATIMDGALLLVAANEKCPQPQTREHLMALKICGIKNIVIVQNKIDLVTESEAMQNYSEIQEFIKNTDYKDAPIIPLSANLGINIDLLIKALEETIPTPKRDDSLDPLMFVARSFDINRPGQEIKTIKGGIIGGALKQGKLKVGDEIEIRPGHVYEEANKKVWKPIITKIAGLMTGVTPMNVAGPGGSIAALTLLDPSIVKSDRLTGNIVGHIGKLPPVWDRINLETFLLERVVGAKEDLEVVPIKVGEVLMLNVNSSSTVGIVSKIGKKIIECKLKLPICATKEDRITISRRIGTRFRLIGYGILED